MLLEFLDGKRAYKRISPQEDLKVTSQEQGVKIWDHKDVKDFFVNKALTWKPETKNAVFIPCSRDKPYFTSLTHRQGYLKALRPHLERIDLFVVSEPMTIVPYSHSNEYPVAYYDFDPYRFDSDSARRIFMDRVGAWLGKYHFQYKRKIVVLTSSYLQKFILTVDDVRIPRQDYSEVSFQGSPQEGENPTNIERQVKDLLS